MRSYCSTKGSKGMPWRLLPLSTHIHTGSHAHTSSLRIIPLPRRYTATGAGVVTEHEGLAKGVAFTCTTAMKTERVRRAGFAGADSIILLDWIHPLSTLSVFIFTSRPFTLRPRLSLHLPCSHFPSRFIFTFFPALPTSFSCFCFSPSHFFILFYTVTSRKC